MPIKHDPENPATCYCEECVCRNYPEIARRHPNCRSASTDVAYRKQVPIVVDSMFRGLSFEEFRSELLTAPPKVNIKVPLREEDVIREVKEDLGYE